jgi:HSP20 family protein
VFRSAFLPGRAAREYPLVNLYQDQDIVFVEALAPGADASSFKLSVTGNTLTISGEKRRTAAEVKPEHFHREERAAGKFVRSIEIPVEVEVDDNYLKAEYTNGLLLIQLAKSEKTKPRQINVQIVS